MNVSVANNSILSCDNLCNTDIEQSETKFTQKLWVDTKPTQVPNVLDPDDTLMKKFQDALKEHLTRVDKRLNDEILELETNIKCIEKEREGAGLQLYYAQQEVVKQQMSIEKYQSMIANVISLRDEKDAYVKDIKSLHKTTHIKLLNEKKKEESLAYELEQLTALQAKFSEWQTELENSLAISKQVSKKDKIVQQELITQKQQKDYIIYQLMEEVWRIKTEIANLDVQLQLKNKEKIETCQMIADVNTDLEALHKQHANLCSAWNSVILNITKRNKVYEQLNAEREYVIFRNLNE